MSQEKKRLNCYIDLEMYDRLKRVLDIMGVTVTDFINQSMGEFLEHMEQIILTQDKEAFLKMMTKNVDTLQEQIAEELSIQNKSK